jgi:alanine-synthesizing transaminase
MKRDIVSEKATHIKYEIRDIVEVAAGLARLGMKITWENIGDPVAKGEKLPEWIKEIVRELSLRDETYAYSDSQGGLAVREFLASAVTGRGGAELRSEDIIFYNGLGDAIAKVFGFLEKTSRIIGPSPAYSAISAIEASHSGSAHLTYSRSPENHWEADPDEIDRIVSHNDSIAGIAVINPDNPTGAVVSRDTLSGIVRVAKRHGCFLVIDETYSRITYNGAEMVHASEVIEDVPAIVLRSISKEYPWPGARCGWIEIMNRQGNESFGKYADSLAAIKRLEVCSTTLPQLSIPAVYSDLRFALHCEARNRMFEERSREAFDALSGIEGITVSIPKGAFYLTVVFDKGRLTGNKKLRIGNEKIRRFIEERAAGVASDKRFVYYLLASTGICVVPLTGFCSTLHGFRMTLLESDSKNRRWIYDTIGESIRAYLAS